MHVQRRLGECHHVSEMLNPPKPYADDCSNKRDCNDKKKPYVQVPVSRARLEITSQPNLYKKALKAQDFSLIWKQWTDSYSLLNYSFRFYSSTKLLIFCVLLTKYRGKDKRQIFPMGFTPRITEGLEKASEITEPHLWLSPPSQAHHMEWTLEHFQGWWTAPGMLRTSRDGFHRNLGCPAECEGKDLLADQYSISPGQEKLNYGKMGHILNKMPKLVLIKHKGVGGHLHGQPDKPSPEIAPSQPPPPPPKPGFSFSSSCSLTNCSSLNSLHSSFLGEDLPHRMTAGWTTRRKLK